MDLSSKQINVKICDVNSDKVRKSVSLVEIKYKKWNGKLAYLIDFNQLN